MVDQARLDAQIALDEGYRAAPYKDTKCLWTVADGRCLETAPFTGQEWKQMLDAGWVTLSVSMQGAAYLLHAKEAQAIAALKSLLPNWGTMGDVRQNALVEECYQLGNSFLVGWPHTLTAIKNGDWDGAATNEMQSEWSMVQTPGRASKLINMLRTGQWPTP